MTQKKKMAVRIVEELLIELDNEIMKAMPDDTAERTELRFFLLFRTSPKLKQFVYSLIPE